MDLIQKTPTPSMMHLIKGKKKRNLSYSAMKDQLDYLRNVRKPREFTPEELTTRLQHINLMIPEFIDATEANMLTDEEIKDIIYEAMPRGWKTNYINSGKEIHKETLESIKRYMSTQQTSEEKAEKKRIIRIKTRIIVRSMVALKAAKNDHGTTTTVQDRIIIIIIAVEIIITTTARRRIIIIRSPDRRQRINALFM